MSKDTKKDSTDLVKTDEVENAEEVIEPVKVTKEYKVLKPWSGTTYKVGQKVELHPRQAQFLLGSHLELVK